MIRPVVEQVLRSLPALLARRVLVTTPDRTEVIALAEAYGCQVVLLDSPGMGDSLAAAVAACADASGWLVVLGDMPFILPSSIESVVRELGEQMIRVPVYKGAYGHPVAFGAAFGQALQGLSGDRGPGHCLPRGRSSRWNWRMLACCGTWIRRRRWFLPVEIAGLAFAAKMLIEELQA